MSDGIDDDEGGQSVCVPWTMVNQQRVLTDTQLQESPRLADFVKRFPLCFTLDPQHDAWIFDPNIGT